MSHSRTNLELFPLGLLDSAPGHNRFHRTEGTHPNTDDPDEQYDFIHSEKMRMLLLIDHATINLDRPVHGDLH